MVKKVIQILSDAAFGIKPARPLWIADMDFEAEDGRGRLTLTEDITNAKRFDDLNAALEFIHTVPKNHPIRHSDGKPNKLLTAYNCNVTDDNLPPM